VEQAVLSSPPAAKETGMKKYEYKIHYLKMEAGKPNEQQILEALNRFGGEGWRLNRLYGETSLRARFSWRGGLNLLLEREITE
jgi:hypothetical protein